METIAIHPEEYSDGTRPYPFFIKDKKGTVGRQDFWKGNPLLLVGFTDETDRQDIELSLDEFIQNPRRAKGLYPVFERKNGDWFTFVIPVGKVTKIKN